MSVSVASTTLAQIFDHQGVIAPDGSKISGQLAIPEYQRPYRWTEVQIERLLQDYQHYLDDLAQSNADYGYYLGIVILHQSEDCGCLKTH